MQEQILEIMMKDVSIMTYGVMEASKKVSETQTLTNSLVMFILFLAACIAALRIVKMLLEKKR